VLTTAVAALLSTPSKWFSTVVTNCTTSLHFFVQSSNCCLNEIMVIYALPNTFGSLNLICFLLNWPEFCCTVDRIRMSMNLDGDGKYIFTSLTYSQNIAFFLLWMWTRRYSSSSNICDSATKEIQLFSHYNELVTISWNIVCAHCCAVN
jgi:hypothetical protein